MILRQPWKTVLASLMSIAAAAPGGASPSRGVDTPGSVKPAARISTSARTVNAGSRGSDRRQASAQPVLRSGWPVKAGRTAWAPSFAAAREEARRTHRLVMVDFYADWCQACQMLDEQILPAPEVARALRQYVPVRLDVEKPQGQALADRYDAASLPALLFLDPAGAMVDMVPGAEPAPAFARDLDRIAARYRYWMDLKERVATHPEDAAAAVRLATMLVERNQMALAQPLISRVESQGPDQRALLAPLYIKIGGLYLHQRDPASALPWYNRVLASSTNPGALALAHFNRGVCFLQQEKRAEAAAEWKAVLSYPGAPTWATTPAREALQRIGVKGSR